MATKLNPFASLTKFTREIRGRGILDSQSRAPFFAQREQLLFEKKKYPKILLFKERLMVSTQEQV